MRHMLTGVFHETNTQGIGIMYRVINIPKLFEDLKDHDFAAQTCRLKLQIKDSFLPENEGSYFIWFTQGKALLVDEDASDVTLSMDISDFSSLMTCADLLNGILKPVLLKCIGIKNLNNLVDKKSI